ncbi:site-2 protease family protein [Solibacillus sp. FSL K6-1523]|uniref:site-2 protease family protein n=1 Tax=Solibacillus sp. FSL K6-1523 TaxID=2921471 RepID=UPI0030FCFE3B
MKITIHPLFLLLLLLFVLSGNIALYSVILISLLFHELGHFMAAKCVGAQIKRCVILPYGGEMTIKNEHQLSFKQLTIIALGGPIATVFGIVVAYTLPPILQEGFINAQMILLVINLLPIWPLDGGRIICYSILQVLPKSVIFETYLSLSIGLLTVIILVSLMMLPESISLTIVSLFLWSKVIGEWRTRKYRSAFEKLVMNRLT